MEGACCYRTFTTTRSSVVGNTQNLQIHCRVSGHKLHVTRENVNFSITDLKPELMIKNLAFVLPSVC